MLCSVADQGVAALTNIAVVIVAARQSSAAGFAAFSVVYAAFTVLLGLFTAYVGQALVLERGDPRAVRSACRSAVAFTACASAALGLPAAAVLWAASGDGDGIMAGAAALGLVLPVALTQDALRYAFATLRLPHRALAADLLRLAAAVPALSLQPHGAGPARLVTVWGLSALPALAAGLALLAPRVRGARARPRGYLRRGHLGRRFAVEFGVGNAGTQLAVIGLGVIADPLAVGALRGATTLFGPMNVLFNAATGFGPPLLARAGGGAATATRTTAGTAAATAAAAAPSTAARTARVSCAAGGVLAGIAVAWTAVLTLLPGALGGKLLGDTWASASALLPATGSQYAAMALGTCGLLTLRVLRPRTTLPLQLVFSALSVCCLLGGYQLGGVLGAAWGLCAGSFLKAGASWLRAVRVVRAQERGAGREGEAEAVRAGAWAEPGGGS